MVRRSRILDGSGKGPVRTHLIAVIWVPTAGPTTSSLVLPFLRTLHPPSGLLFRPSRLQLVL